MIWIGEKRRRLLLAAAIAWMVLIFAFSQQKAEESGAVSGTITYRMAEGVSEVFGLDWQEEALVQHAEDWQHPVRKAAHMTEYAVLAGLLLANMIQYEALKKRAYLWAWLGSALYAATDEFHQLFIEGRSGELRDVCIDSTGAFLGLLAIYGAVCGWKYLHRQA